MTEIRSLEVYADGSGAPAVAVEGPYAYACDTIGGEIRMNLIRPVYGSRTANKVAHAKCLAAYRNARDAALPEGWLKLNLAMYA